LTVVTYNYISIRYQNNILQKQFDVPNNGIDKRIFIYESENETSCNFISEDEQLLVYFTFDDQGLKNAFGSVDRISGKTIVFNFMEEGELASFCYKDNKYDIATNVAAVHPGILLEREEWINGIGKLYTLLPNGTTEIKRLFYDDTGILHIE
jgi:hypothetical protein